MHRFALAILIAPSLAHAGADEQPAIDPSVIQGPYADVDDYCEFRDAGHARELFEGPPCDRDVVIDPDAPRRPTPKAGSAILDYQFVRTETELHVVVQTARGWYGRSIATRAMGDSLDIGEVTLRDVTGDRDKELVFDITRDHSPCGCEDLYSRTTETFACTVIDGDLRCTDGIASAVDMHLADIWSWSATLSYGRDGRVKRTIASKKSVPKRELRALDAPFRVTFHR